MYSGNQVWGSACTKPGIYDWAAMYICVRGIKFGEVPVRSLVYMCARPCTYVFGESSLALFLRFSVLIFELL